MWQLQFTIPIPTGDPGSLAGRFAQARFLGSGQVPCPIEREVCDRSIIVRCLVANSGCLQLPWHVNGFGEVMVQTANLMARPEPYSLMVELARGELNRIRNLLADWEQAGMRFPETFANDLRLATRLLFHAIHQTDSLQSDRQAEEALCLALWTGERFTETYRDEQLARRVRDQSQPRLGCVVDAQLAASPPTGEFRGLFDHLNVPVSWRMLEPRQGEYVWDDLDRRIDWCASQGIPFCVGPLLDFHPRTMPDWLRKWESDVQMLVTLLLDFVETCVGRYQGKVSCWETSARTNTTRMFSLTEDQLLWLTSRAIAAVRSVEPNAQCLFCVDRPWGEYQLEQGFRYPPEAFAEWLLRMDLSVSALVLEIAMGYASVGCFCRTLQDFSQMLDSYGRIGVPIVLRMCFPSEPVPVDADGNAMKSAGYWHGEASDSIQADWVEKFVGTALAKPFVQTVTWGRYHDVAGEDRPFSGLVSADHRPKSALDRIQSLRRNHIPRTGRN